MKVNDQAFKLIREMHILGSNLATLPFKISTVILENSIARCRILENNLSQNPVTVSRIVLSETGIRV